MSGDILFLAHRIPWPPDRGDKIRSWHMLRHLGTLGTVHLACFADDEADAAHMRGLRAAMGSSLGKAHIETRGTARIGPALKAIARGEPISLALFDSPALRAFVERMLASGNIDAVFAFSFQMAQFVPKGLSQRFVMDFVDMDSAKYAEYGRGGWGAMHWVHRREARKLLAFERRTAGRADTSLFVTEAEADLFRARAAPDGADIRAIGNGIDLDFYDPEAEFEPLRPGLAGEGPLILFTGQMDYRPNIEAVTCFARDVLPRIREAEPRARFAIVGRKPADAVLRLQGRPGILVTGAVEDVRSWLAAADVVVAPLRIARGVQNKVLEAMAMARPVVASPHAFEGIDAKPGKELIVAGGAEEQARAVLDLLTDKEKAEAIGAAARTRMQKSYRWDAKLKPLAGIIFPKRAKASA